ncbi:MAG: addiction module protein [Chitinophagaceae bacterium]|nr:addiction module protein [Chitinophagaceae bacterium]
MSTSTNIYLPLQFNQLVDLIKALPKKEKQQLIEVLEQDESLIIPEWQKQEVRKRIKKYNKYPELLIDEKKALQIINKM